MTARHERRARRRETLKRQRSIMRRGLPAERDAQAAAAAAMLFREILADGNNPERALDAAEQLLGLYETSIRRQPPQRAVDCRLGCTYCCHNFVTISAPEAFLIAAWLDGSRRPSGARSVDVGDWRERARRVIGHSVAERLGKKLPCAFLQDGLCVIYAHRPLACRSCVSFSVNACRRSFEGEEVEIDTPVEAIMLRSNANFAMLAALRSLGYPATGYELCEAVTRILDTPAALQRWSAGEDILAGVQTVGPNKPSVDRALSALALRILP